MKEWAVVVQCQKSLGLCVLRGSSVYIQINEATGSTPFSLKAWKKEALHPKEMTEATVEWIFVVDLLNFSFWSTTYEARVFIVVLKFNRFPSSPPAVDGTDQLINGWRNYRWSTKVNYTKVTGLSAPA